jgi:hypothetical protein
MHSLHTVHIIHIEHTMHTMCIVVTFCGSKDKANPAQNPSCVTFRQHVAIAELLQGETGEESLGHTVPPFVLSLDPPGVNGQMTCWKLLKGLKYRLCGAFARGGIPTHMQGVKMALEARYGLFLPVRK